MTAYRRHLMWQRIDAVLSEASAWLAIVAFWALVATALVGIGVGVAALLMELAGWN